MWQAVPVESEEGMAVLQVFVGKTPEHCGMAVLQVFRGENTRALWHGCAAGGFRHPSPYSSPYL